MTVLIAGGGIGGLTLALSLHQIGVSAKVFESVLELPQGYDLGQAKAAYLNGFLRIDVPLVQRSSQTSSVPIADGN